MENPYLPFMSQDAITYVDAYRKAIEWTPEKIAQQMAWLGGKVNGEELQDSAVYAEYRGYEHALRWVSDREEPDFFVFLGSDADYDEARHSAGDFGQQRIEELTEQLRSQREETNRLKREKQEADGGIARLKSELSACRHQLSNCHGMQYILMAVAGAFFLVTLILALLR
ncbi:MAG: hypothetical protein ACOC3U_04570 [Thiohalospira sp.]